MLSLLPSQLQCSTEISSFESSTTQYMSWTLQLNETEYLSQGLPFPIYASKLCPHVKLVMLKLIKV